MPDIPSKVYAVRVTPSSNSWLSGALNDTVTPPTYKGQNTTNFNPSTTDVGWTVQLNNAGSDWTVTFTGGNYANNKITGGTYSMISSTQGVTGTGDDTWSADGQGEDEEGKRTATYNK